MKGKMDAFGWIVVILLVLAGINWGLLGLFDFNLIEAIIGTSVVTTIIYVLMGLAGLYKLYWVFK